MRKNRWAHEMSGDQFAGKLTGIFESKLAAFSGEGRDARIDAFYRKASSTSGGTRATTLQPERTLAIPRAAQSRE